MTNIITIATRKSPLALWQAHAVKNALEERHPKLQVELLPLTSSGDQVQDRPLADLGGKGLFVKEIESALIENKADIAVHSGKDMPPEDPEGLILAGVLEREDPRDAWISDHTHLKTFHGIAGTSSPRRSALIQHHAPNSQTRPIRGNIDTRVQKYQSGDYQGILLAMAGLKRLQHPALSLATPLATDQFVPAACQGTIAMQCRQDDVQTQDLIASINHTKTLICTQVERALVAMIQGDCHSPIGAYAQIIGENLRLKGCILDARGEQKVMHEATGSIHQAQTLAPHIFDLLKKSKALDLLQLGH